MKVTCEKIVIKIQKDPEQTKTAAGLSIPNPNSSRGISRAVVMASDNEKVKENDEVLVYKQAGTEFTLPSDGETYRTISAAEIIVIL